MDLLNASGIRLRIRIINIIVSFQGWNISSPTTPILDNHYIENKIYRMDLLNTVVVQILQLKSKETNDGWDHTTLYKHGKHVFLNEPF